MVARLKVYKFNAVAATQSIRIVWGKERLCALIRGIDEGVVGVDAPARRAVVELGLNALPQRLSGTPIGLATWMMSSSDRVRNAPRPHASCPLLTSFPTMRR